MSGWKKHVHANKLAYHWKNREISDYEQKRLYFKRVLNYQGFWLNKIIHLLPYYFLYKRGFFLIKSESKFWTSLGLLTLTLIASVRQTDTVLYNLLMFELEKLNHKYGTQIDEYRREYQAHKNDKKMIKEMEIEKLHEEGKLVSEMLKKN
jgi:hypothetical protein